MNASDPTHRRGFLARVIGAAAAASASIVGGHAVAAQDSGNDDWIKEVKGANRCLFDFPQHKNGMPLLHILNYLNTYKEAYKAGPGQVAAVGTFYSIGNQASMSMAFNDAMWAKYKLGEYTGLKDAYKSLNEALQHGGIAHKVKVNLDWIESEIFEKEDPAPYLEGVNGILVPGGFGERGSEGKIAAAGIRTSRWLDRRALDVALFGAASASIGRIERGGRGTHASGDCRSGA